ncbi:hypothetical protein HMPREF1398_01528 [Helicobacter pylori GAM117Ai]|nr:hypothetical protein HMPREF1398_01528 [Helicobacter pylori GAM117Ai]
MPTNFPTATIPSLAALMLVALIASLVGVCLPANHRSKTAHLLASAR